MNAADLDAGQLTAALQRADHSWFFAAAVNLLISQGYWLHRRELLQVVEIDVVGGLLYASIEWEDAAVLVAAVDAPDGEKAILRLACSIAGYPRPESFSAGEWTVQGMLRPLDPDCHTAAVTALAHAATGGRA